MIVETRSIISLKEYMTAYLRIFYAKPGTLVILGVAVLDIVLLLTKTITSGSGTLTYWAVWFPIFASILFPVANIFLAKNHYNSNKCMRQERLYIFDDDKITYKAEGWEGFIEWDHVVKYQTIKHFILLYMASRQAIFVKTDGLTGEQIAFIKSKIKQP